MTKFASRFLMVVILTIVCTNSWATNYYVKPAPEGNNGNSGSINRPFATIQKAHDVSLAGDTIFIMPGTYTATTNITRSGTASQYIVYKAYGSIQPKIFVSSNTYNAVIINSNYIVFDGIEVMGNNENLTYADALASYNIQKAGGSDPNAGIYNTNGISIGGPDAQSLNPHHVIVRNCKVHDFPGGGISAIQADYITWEGNTVYNNGWYMIYGGSGMSILTPINSDAGNPLVYKNIVRNNICYGNKTTIPWISTGALSDGNGIIIDVNQSTYNAQSNIGGLYYNGRTLVENNVSFNNGGSGIHAFKASYVDIINNTAYGNGTVMGYANIFAGYTTADVKIMHNIIYASTGGKCTSNSNNTGVVYNYNIYFNGTTAGSGANDKVLDPQFVNASIDPTVANFSLNTGSPAIDGGNNVTGQFSTKDILGNSRPYGTKPDIGAYEFTGSVYIPPVLPPVVPTNVMLGNLVVTRVGDGSTALGTNTAPVGLLEFNRTSIASTLATTSQTPIKTVNLSGGSGNNLTLTGTTAAEGQLSLSQDGRYLTLIGYNVPAGELSTNTCVSGFTRTNNGAGYTAAPTVTISAPNIAGGVQATAGAQLGSGGTAGQVTNIYVINNGSGYTSAPTVTLSAPTSGTTATATALITNPYWQGSAANKTIARVDYAGNVDYTTKIANNLSSNGTPAPAKMVTSIDGSAYWASNNVLMYATHGATGTGAGVSGAGIQIANLQSAGVNIFKNQLYNTVSFANVSYYNGMPTTSIAGTTTTAIGTAVLSGNTLGAITVGNAGAGYTAGYSPSVTIGTHWVGSASYALNAQITTSFGRLYTVTTAGTSGTAPPTHTSGAVTATGGTAEYTYAGVAATATATLSGTTVGAFTVTRAGSGYTSAPSVTVVHPSALLPQPTSSYGYQSMVLFDLDPTADWNGTGYDVMYLADRNNGLAKYYWDGFQWTALNINNGPSGTEAIFPGNGLASIIGTLNSAGQPVIYGIVGYNTTGNNSGICAITDASAYNASIGGNATIAYIAKADANYAFRGIAFAPTQNAYTWSGSSSTTYNNTSNWYSQVVPSSTSSFYVPSGLTNYPTVTTATTVNGGTLAAGARLSASAVFTNNGTITLKSDATGTASIGNSSANITGNVTVERFISSNNRKKYVLVTSPVTSTLRAGWQEGGATVSGYGTHITQAGGGSTNGYDGNATSGASLFTYNDDNAAGSKWVASSATTTTAASIAPGKGYLLFVRGDRGENRPATGNSSNTVLRATGTIGQGTINPTLKTGASQFTLVANPYPSAIDWNTGITKTNLFNSFTVYDPNLKVFVSSNGIIKAPNVSQQQPAYIQSGQAFFVQNTTAGNGTISFTEASKTTAATTTSSTTLFGEGTAKNQQLNINVYRTVDNAFADGVVAVFGTNYKALVDGSEDFRKFTNFNETFALRRNLDTLGLEARPLIVNADTLYFSMNNFGKKDYRLVIDGSNFTNITATLEDRYKATKTPIDVNGSTQYDFTVNNDAASMSKDRFIITLGNKATIVADAPSTGLFVKMSPNPVSNQLMVSFRNAIADETIINIVNSLGQVVKTVNEGSVNSGNVIVAFGDLSSGIYSVQLLSGGKQVSTQKIVKQ